MLRSDYKYSREPSTESVSAAEVAEKDRRQPLTGVEQQLTVGEGSGSGGRRSGSMKHWSLAALGKRAREGLRRCNTVRSGLGWAGGSSSGGGGGSSTTFNDDNASDKSSSSGLERGRRNAMSNIFLGLPSSGVRRLYAIYGIDDTRGRGAKSATPGGRGVAEESLFAKHTRTSSVRLRPPSYQASHMATMQQQHQQMMMLQQQQQHQLQPGHLDRRRASSMRDHSRHRPSSGHGNW